MIEWNKSVRLPRITLVSGSYSCVADWTHARPVRPHWRIWWNPEMGAAIEHGGISFPLVNDRLVMVPPHVSISHVLECPVWSLALHVEVDEPMELSESGVFNPVVPADLTGRLQLIADSYPRGLAFSGGGTGDMGLSLLLGEILYRVFQCLPSTVWQVSRKDSRVESSIDVMRRRLVDGCSNDELAREAYLSTNAFIRLFKGEMGVSPQAYLQSLRLDRAARLLQHTDDSVEQIAAACGFCDRNYLSKLFKRRFSVGPAHYRR